MEFQFYVGIGFIYILGYILSPFFYYYLIDYFLNRFPPLQSETKENVQLGRYIGILERLLIITAIYAEQFSLIPMLLAAKSLMRFPEVNKGDKQYAEYFLIGTLLSFFLAILTGIVFLSYIKLVYIPGNNSTSFFNTTQIIISS